eukprot:5050354-Alexandrium_andersonii.AAC.1
MPDCLDPPGPLGGRLGTTDQGARSGPGPGHAAGGESAQATTTGTGGPQNRPERPTAPPTARAK